MEALCRRIVEVGKQSGPKAARWGLQRQFPKQRMNKARQGQLRYFNQSINTNISRRKPSKVKKQFGPFRSAIANTQKLRIRTPVNRFNLVSPPSSLNNSRKSNLPPSPNGSVNSRYTANTPNTPNVPLPNQRTRRTRRN